MAATTATKIKEITGSTLADATIDPFIPAASCMIDQCDDGSIVAACLDEALTYLSAHLLVTSEVGKASRQVEGETLEDVYKVQYGKASGTSGDVLSTTFGTTANMLTNGCLAELGKQPVCLLSVGSIC